MKNIFLLTILIAITFSACDHSTKSIPVDVDYQVLPQPKEICDGNKVLVLSLESELYSSNKDLIPLLDLFSIEMENNNNIRLSISTGKNNKSDIIFLIDTNLAEEEYRIKITNSVDVTGGSYQALAMAKTTLLQVATLQNGRLCFPAIEIRDYPDANYRGVMLDLARQWHTTETIKQVIDMAAFYKLNYVHLHFSDYQSYTLPSTILPKLPTEDRHYTFEELEELEQYSQLRGITIIPEVDIPGHSSPFVEKYPEIFAIKAVDENPWIINMGKEEVYQTLDELIGEIAGIFKASPYIHIGGDEAIFYKSEEDPFVQQYIEKHGIENDMHELYRHFLVRMNDIVKSYDKQMCVWEGFRNDGTIEIPKDIIVFEFETNRYLPNLLVEDGYTVVNTSWKPLYVVNSKKWEPKAIYEWNMWRWENWYDKAPSFTPIQLEKTPLVTGAQMCAWEQPGEWEIPSLRRRLPAFIERIWNTEQQIPYEDLMNRVEALDTTLSRIINDTRQDTRLEGYNFVGE